MTTRILSLLGTGNSSALECRWRWRTVYYSRRDSFAINDRRLMKLSEARSLRWWVILTFSSCTIASQGLGGNVTPEGPQGAAGSRR